MSADEPLHLPLLHATPADKGDGKTLLRGWLHVGVLPVAVIGGLVLVALANGVAATWSSFVFVLSSLLLFGISAVYHRFNWSPPVKAVFRRLDHANIFILIAGTYTPLGVLALPSDKGFWLLLGVWIGAGLGILFRVLWLGAPRWAYVPLYLILGLVSVIYIPDLAAANVAMLVLVLVGGAAYERDLPPLVLLLEFGGGAADGAVGDPRLQAGVGLGHRGGLLAGERGRVLLAGAGAGGCRLRRGP